MMYRKNYLKCLYSSLVIGVAVLFFAVQPSLAEYLVQPSAYWELNDADPISGAADRLGVVAGTCATCPASTAGQVGTAFDFTADGDDAIQVTFAGAGADVFDFAVTPNGFSIELWINLAEAPGGTLPDVLIGRFDNPNTVWWIGLQPNGTVAALFKDSDGGADNNPQLNGSTNVANGSWHHIAVVRDGAGETITLYVDGALETSASTATDARFDSDFTSGVDVQLGQLAGTSNFDYDGALDNIAVYSAAALTAEQVAQHYGIGLSQHNLEEDFAPFFTETTKTTAIDSGFQATLKARATGKPIPSYASTDLPAGATLDSATGDITWLPTDQQAAQNTVAFNVSASNSLGASTTNQSWSATITDACTSDITGYWKLDDTDPSAGAIDTVGANNATCGSTECPATVTGQVGAAFDFAIADSHMSIADTGDNGVFDFAAGSNFSMEYWMKRDGSSIETPFSQNEVIMSRWETARWWVGLRHPGGQVGIFLSDADGGISDLTGTKVITDNAWHHIVIVRDGTADTLKVYVDGALDINLDQSGADVSTDGSFAADGPISIGRFGVAPPANQFFYGGAVDNIALYDSALSDAMAAQHATAASDQALCNQAPTITSTEVTTASQDVAYTYGTATATDPEGHDITWSVTSPAGMAIDAVSGAVTWTPDNTASATETVTIVATDKYGATATQTFTVNVTLTGNSAPDITSTAPTAASVGNVYTYDAEATDANAGDTMTWSLAAGAPADMTVDASTGVVSWTPPAGSEGDVTYTLMVSDGSASDTQAVTVTVTTEPVAPAGGGGGGGGGGCFISAFAF